MFNKKLLFAVCLATLFCNPVLAEDKDPKDANSKDSPKEAGSAVEPAMLFASAPGDELPKLYYLSPLAGVFEAKPGASNCACLIITKHGANLFLYPYKLGDLKELDKQTAQKLFGSEDTAPGKGKYATFHLIGYNRSEPNIFHVDTEFGDSDTKLTRYRVRGFGIIEPKWTSMDSKAVH